MPFSLRAARRAPPPPADLRTRLRLLRARAEKGISRATGMGLLAALIPLSAVALMVTVLVAVPLGMAPAGTGAPALGYSLAVFMVLLFVLAAWGIWALIRFLIRRLFERHYVRTWRELFSTSFMTLVTVEDYTGIIAQRVEGQFGLRWFSPPAPRSLEHQLEFAAVYQLGLQRMLRGVGRLDNGPLWQGGIGWSAGRFGYCCSCLTVMLSYGAALAFPLLIVGVIYYVQGRAALAAYCDFLLHDDAPAPRVAAEPER